ncbi:MAG: amino acid ABC transporter permease [Planctomycetota bacterium]|jgi:polar amino acid transport system permease protein|nr:amino acid ABC transporter permease [Planctomycetota bacterium]
MVNWGLLSAEIGRGNLPAGAAMTLGITALAVAIGVVLGLCIAMMRLSKSGWLRILGTVYVEAFRGTPMLVQILLFYFGIFPMLGLSRVAAVWAGITALGLNSGAYLGEIFRGGIQSIDRGQREAALSLGMKNHQVMRYVILPQALANALPAIGNEFITMIKDSSLVSFIAVSELTYRAMLVAARHYEYFTMYAGIAIIYFIMTFTTSRLLAALEKRLREGNA